MSTWVALSEIVRNIALSLAAFVGAILAWRQLSPAALQARSAIAQAELARRAHVTELFNELPGNSAIRSSKSAWRQSRSCARSREIFPIFRTLFLSYSRHI